MAGAESGVVEQGGEEVGRTGAGRHAVGDHGVEHNVRLPGVDEMDGLTAVHGQQQGAEQADGVAHRRADQHRWALTGGRELADLGADAPVRVHHPFGIGGGARGPRDERRGRRVDGGGLVDRRAVGEGREGRPPPVLLARHERVLQGGRVAHHGVEQLEELDASESVGGHQEAGARATEDVAHLLGPVEVHDGDDVGAEQAGPVEDEGGLDAVGELEGDHVAGADAVAGKPAGDAPGAVDDVGESALEGAGGRADAEADVGTARQGGEQEVPESLVGPEAGGRVAARQLGRHGARLPVEAHGPPVVLRVILRRCRRTDPRG